ncbi:MAG: radical SAM protein [Deltaproteobacteria bacterium]|nr:radical SAM protein [Deltaproteobacteria bacterium]
MSVTDDDPGSLPAARKVVQREAAATEERQWVRLTRRCNNHCLFCHDAERHDGLLVEPDDVRAEIRAGRERGATRLILSGGEPTIHPGFLYFVRDGREVGYTWVQCVSNGRMFAYDQFVRQAAQAGLSEATLSLHGHTEELFDRLVGVKGGYAQALRGLRNLLRAGLVVSVDVVVNQLNVRHLRDLLLFYIGLGVREFDLLYLIPFGRGWGEFRQELFFDPAVEREHIFAALELARRPDLHLWTNRWPAPLLEGAEELIQDPHKIQDEVRGGFENFTNYLERGEGPDCVGDRCGHCFLQHFCRTLFDTRERLQGGTFDVVALEARAAAGLQGGVREVLARQVGAAYRLRADHAAEVAAALAALPRGDAASLEVDVPGLRALPSPIAARVRRAVVRRRADLAPALALPGAVVEIPAERALWTLAREALAQAADRVVLRLPGRELMSQTLALDPPPAELARLAREAGLPGARAEGVPACLGSQALAPASSLDVGILLPDGHVDLFAFVRWYVCERYLTRSLRCGTCAAGPGCEGAHINYVRAHGFGWMSPLAGGAGSP